VYYTRPIITTVIIIIFVILTLLWNPGHLASGGLSGWDAGQHGTYPGNPGLVTTLEMNYCAIILWNVFLTGSSGNSS